MEAKLKNLVDSVYKVADLRNLDENNPIAVKIDTENASLSTIIIVAYYEPWRGRYPLNVSWIDANPSSDTFKQIFKRVSKHYTPETPQYQHEWVLLYAYRDVFVPPQYYDDSDLAESQEFTARVSAHLENYNNPHDTNATQVHALSINGGTLLGDLVLHSDPLTYLSATTKQYVDEHDTTIFNFANSVNDHSWEIDERLVNVESVSIPTLFAYTTDHEVRLESLEALTGNHSTRINTLETSNSLLTNRVNTFDSRIVSVENSQFALNTRLLSADAKISALENVDVSELGQLASLNPRVATLETSLTSITSRVVHLENFENITLTRLTYTPKSFKFSQDVPSSTWIIPHNLNSNYVLISIIIGEEIIQPDNTIITDNNTIHVTFNIPRLGRALVVVG